MLTKPPSLAVLIAIMALNPLSLNILQPALPDLARALATDYDTAQLSLSLYLLASALAQIALGPISDRIGRRPVALWGLIIYIAGSLVCVAASSIGVLVGGRIVQAVGGIAGFVVARAVIRDLYGLDAAASRLGYAMTVMVAVPMVTPLIGGWIAERAGHEGVFTFTAAFGLAAFAFTFADLRETRKAVATAAALSSSGAFVALLRARAFLGHATAMSFTSGIFYAFLAGSPYVVIDLQHGSPSEYGFWFALAALGYMFGNFLSGKLSVRVGAHAMERTGTLLGILGVIVLAICHALLPAEPAALFLGTGLIWIGNGVTLPAATASALSVRPDIAGAAAGLSGALQLGVGALVAYLSAHLLADSAWPMILLMGLMALVAFAGHLFAGKVVEEPRVAM